MSQGPQAAGQTHDRFACAAPHKWGDHENPHTGRSSGNLNTASQHNNRSWYFVCTDGYPMRTERLQMMPTVSGFPTVQVDGVAYHSLYNPLREAEKVYASLHIEDADVLLHF